MLTRWREMSKTVRYALLGAAALVAIAVGVVGAYLILGSPAPPSDPAAQDTALTFEFEPDDTPADSTATPEPATPTASPPTGTAAIVPSPTKPSTPTAQPAYTPTPKPLPFEPYLPPEPTPTPAPAALPTPTPGPLASLSAGQLLHELQPATAGKILGIPWIANGIATAERAAVQEIVYTGAAHPEFAQRLLEYEWLRDGVDEDELQALTHLRHIATRDRQVATELAESPILHAITPSDLPALAAIETLARVAPELAVQTGAVPDDTNPEHWNALLTVLPTAQRYNPGLAEALVRFGDISITEFEANLVISGTVPVTLIRIHPAGTDTETHLRHALQNVETFMGMPYPTDRIVIFFANSLPPGAASYYYGDYTVIRPIYDSDSPAGRRYAPRALAHALARYYWNGNPVWLDEGAAALVAAVSENARTRKPVVNHSQPCPYARYVAAISDLEDENSYSCQQSLGERLFLSLYRQEPYLEFLNRFRTLYLNSGPERALTGVDVKAAFAHSPKGHDTTDTWLKGPYPGPTLPPDQTWPDQRLDGINGYLDGYMLSAGDATNLDGELVINPDQTESLVTLELSYRLLPPVASGEKYILDLEVVEYYEDGFETGRRSYRFEAFPMPEKPDAPNPNYRRISIGPTSPEAMTPGRYWALVYHHGRKVTQQTFVITEPESQTDPEFTKTPTP